MRPIWTSSSQKPSSSSCALASETVVVVMPCHLMSTTVVATAAKPDHLHPSTGGVGAGLTKAPPVVTTPRPTWCYKHHFMSACRGMHDNVVAQHAPKPQSDEEPEEGSASASTSDEEPLEWSAS